MLEKWLLDYWWFWIILVLIFWRQILDGITAPGETLKLLRDWRKRNEVITLQYNSVEAIIRPPNKEGLIGVTVRAILDNPHPFPIKIRLETVVTTYNWMLEADISDKKLESIVGAGARNFAVAMEEAAFRLRPKQEGFPIRLVWEIKYGRVESEPTKLDRTLRIMGTLNVRKYAGNLFETQWKEEKYSDPPVRDWEGGTVISDTSGEMQRRD